MAVEAEQQETPYFVREIEKNDGCIMKMKQCYKGDVGCVVWDAAIVLAKYLETKQFHDPVLEVNTWADKDVLELGAGTGVVGLMAATLGAQVTVTDLEDLQTLLKVNIQENQRLVSSGSITAKEDVIIGHKIYQCVLSRKLGCISPPEKLRRMTSPGGEQTFSERGEDVSEFMLPPHYILMADCIYYEQSIVPLVETLKLLTGPETCIICCYEQRTVGINPKVERQFFELLQQDFKCEEVPLDKQDPEFSTPDIRILHIRRKV